MAKKTLIEKIKEDIVKENLQMRTAKTRSWLKSKMNQLRGSAVTPILDNPKKSDLKTRISIGKMYFYIYDAKHKDKLPYFDMFPLVIPIEPYSDGFLGLNLHYISPNSRISLLSKLDEIVTNKNYNAQTRLKISYAFLQSSSRMYEAIPCVKRYLYSQVSSPFLEVKSDEWEIAALLPVAGFVNASDNKVWKNSQKRF
jgi:hypothetical protein